MLVRNSLMWGLVALLIVSCSPGQDNQKNRSGSGTEKAAADSASGVKKINQLLQKDKYEQALTRLEKLDQLPDSTRQRLREKTHLNYGLYLEYRGGDRSMRERMTNALRQFIEVLHINRNNQKALSEIKQIMGIYGTMPNKSAPADIKKELNSLGVRY